MAGDRHDTRPDDKRRRQPDWQPDASPGELKPIKLNSEPAREVPPSPLVFRQAQLSRPGDSAPPMSHINASRFDFQPMTEIRPELRREIEREFHLQEIPVTSMQMRELRERRIAARDLGWKVPGKRIRIDPGV